MKGMRRTYPGRLADNRGSVGVVVALTLVILLGFSAMSIDIGRALVVRNELQNAADAGTLAGARQLGLSLFYQDTSLGTGQDVSPLTGLVRERVRDVAARNPAEGVFPTIPAGDIQVGQWSTASRTVIPTGVNPDAVQVTARRDGGPNASLGTFLGGIFGVSSLNVRTTAAARLSPTSRTDPGDLNAPFAVSIALRPTACGQLVSYGAGGNGLLGVTTFSNPAPPIGASRSVRTTALSNLINDITAGTFTPPATVANENTVNLIFARDIFFLPSNAIARYPVGTALLVPVVGGDVLGGGAFVIQGYATVLVTRIDALSMQGTVLCNRTGGRRGGNTNDFGTNGLIPALVL